MSRELRVLSLFDGMGCGRLALHRLNVKCAYWASEIDPHAMDVTQHTFPDVVQLGDVRLLDADKLPTDIDLLLAGSPCQGLSRAGHGEGLMDARSSLFFHVLRIRDIVRPRHILLENVLMSADNKQTISHHMGLEPVRIDSALVSAHHRERLYWTSLPRVPPPHDRDIVLADVVDDAPPPAEAAAK